MKSLDPGPQEPPADPEMWTDEQWIEWLKATDAEIAADEGRLPATAVGRFVHSAGGQVLGQTMVGLAQAIYGRGDDKPAVVAEANSEPEKDRSFALHLDPEHPEQSFVVVTPPPESLA